MCQFCERPDLTSADVLARVRDVMDRRRFGFVSVQGSRRTAEFSYTVGLTQYGLPELVITAVRPDSAVQVLSVWGDYLLDGSVVLPGEVMHSGPWLLQAVEVDAPEDHLLVARELFGDRVRGLQLAWADEGGRWPWEPGHRARAAGQPLLGVPAPWYCPEHAPDRLDVPPHL